MSYLQSIKSGAIAGWREHQIVPSLTAAQAVLESGWGQSSLAKPPYNNQFGIKASSDWTGRKVNMPTREYGPNGYYWINADFRAYDSVADSVKDHAAFFSNTEWRRNNYRHVVGEKDYKKACVAVQQAGYATDPGYANSLIRLIEEHKLYEWDKEAFASQSTPVPQPPQAEEQPAARTVDKTVGDTLTTPARQGLNRFNVTLIGDQYAVATQPYLDNKFNQFTHTVRNDMQITHDNSSLNATEILRTMKTAGILKDYVVVVLGTNRGVSKNEIDEFVKVAGIEHKILFVDTTAEVAHRASVAQEYYAASIRHQNVYYVNWTKYSEPLITSFYTGNVGSRVTMTSEGIVRHAEYIMQAVFEASAGVFDGGKRFVSSKHFGIEELEYNFNGLYSPKGQSVMYNPNANEKWGFRAGEGNLWIEGLLEMPNETNKHILAGEASKFLEKHSVPAVQYTIHLSDLPNTVSIGDRGTFVDHYFNPPLAIEATVIEISTSDTDPSSNTIVVGNVEVLDFGANDEVKALEKQVQRVRNEVVSEYRKGAPIELVTETSYGINLSDDVKETTIMIKAMQSGFNVTDRYSYFWERYTSDKEADNEYNTKLLENHRSPYLKVAKSDLLNGAANFVVRAYDEDGNLAAIGGADIRYIQRGKSAYEIWLDAGNLGTEQEFLQKLKGADGKDGVGVPGAPGQDGRTSYTHIAYADGTQGENFTTGEPENRSYMGTYSDFEEQDSTDYTRYRWVRIKGADGEAGAVIYRTTNAPNARVGIDYLLQTDGRIGIVAEVKNGVITKFNNIISLKGPSGQTSYTHTAFANNETGTDGFSTTDKTGKKYMGIYSDFNATASQDPSKYKWLKMAQAYAEEFKSELDNKANQRETDEYLNHIRGEIQKQRQEQEALASTQALNEVVKNVQLLREAFERDGKVSAEKLLQAVNKLAKIENDLGEFAFRLNAINLVMQFSDEGFVIGNKTKGTYILVTDDEIGLFNNGERVAFIKGGTLQFVQGIFIERVQIGAYMLGAYEDDPEILALRYVGRGNV